jgi:hypothetical protein
VKVKSESSLLVLPLSLARLEFKLSLLYNIYSPLGRHTYDKNSYNNSCVHVIFVKGNIHGCVNLSFPDRTV